MQRATGRLVVGVMDGTLRLVSLWSPEGAVRQVRRQQRQQQQKQKQDSDAKAGKSG